MKVETTEPAFVTRLGMVVPFDTLKKAADECDAYDWMRISQGHYAVKHGETVHIIIVDSERIGCSCGAMTFHCHDNDVCKHIAAFDRRSGNPQKPVGKEIAQELIKAGWIGDKGNLTPPETTLNAEVDNAPVIIDGVPQVDERGQEVYEKAIDFDELLKNEKAGKNATSDPDGEDNGGGDPTPAPSEKPKPPEKITVTCPHCMKRATRDTQAEADAWLENHPCKDSPRRKKKAEPAESNPEPPLGTKMWTRTCPHCDQRFEGGDLDDVKRRHREHVPTCPENPANKANKANKAKEQEQKAVGSKTEPTGTQKEETNMEEEQTTEQEIEVIEEEPTEEPAKTYTHPDGSAFESAEALLDYAEGQKAMTTTSTDKAIDPRTFIAPMIKNLGTPQLTEAGGIRIGRKKGRGTETFDHFIFTLPEKDPTTGDFYRDAKMEELYGDNCRELPVRLLFDNITDCFTTFYAKYGAGGIKIRGDGENWAVTNPDGSKTYIEDPNGEHGFLNDPDVIPQGILTVLVDGQNSVGTVYRFRTSGWNSIKGILASLSLCSEAAKRAGGRIAFLPMLLVYRTKEVTPKGERYKKTIPVITIEFRGTIKELQEKSRDAMKYLSSASGDALQLAGANVYDPNVETIEEQQDVAAEFYPGAD